MVLQLGGGKENNMGDPPWITEEIGIEKWNYINLRTGDRASSEPWKKAGVSAEEYYRVLKSFEELQQEEQDKPNLGNRRR